MNEKDIQLLWNKARLRYSEACKEVRVTEDREEYRRACKEYAEERKLYYMRRAVLRDGIISETTPKGEEKKANGMEEKAS